MIASGKKLSYHLHMGRRKKVITTTETTVDAERADNDLSPTEQEVEGQIDRLDGFFSTLSPGVRLLIERVKPNWCSGLLEEIEVTDEQTIDLPYLITTWGGKLLRLRTRDQHGRIRGVYLVPLHSYDPRVYGKIVKPYGVAEILNEDDRKPAPQSQPMMIQAPAAPGPDITALLTGVLKLLETQRVQQFEMFRAMIPPPQPAPAPAPIGGIGDMTSMVIAMKQLRELFADAPPADEMATFLPGILDTVKALLGKENTPKLTAPQQRPTAPAPPPVVTPLRTAPAPDLSAAIASLPPQQAAETVIKALGRMSPDRQEIALNALLDAYGEFEEDEEAASDSGDQEQEHGERKAE